MVLVARYGAKIIVPCSSEKGHLDKDDEETRTNLGIDHLVTTVLLLRL